MPAQVRERRSARSTCSPRPKCAARGGARRGDVLLMRPLVAHSSGRSHPDTPRHRRIIHLEFAAAAELPDGYEWRDFIAPGGR